MKQLYFAEELPKEDVIKLQDEIHELGWCSYKSRIDAGDVLARRQWVKNAGEWLRTHCTESWVGMAYLDEGVLYARFKAAADADAFHTACANF